MAQSDTTFVYIPDDDEGHGPLRLPNALSNTMPPNLCPSFSFWSGRYHCNLTSLWTRISSRRTGPTCWRLRMHRRRGRRPAMCWVNNTNDPAMKLAVQEILADLPWHGLMRGFGYRVEDLAQLLSDEYLEAKIIDAMIAVLALRLRRVGGTLNENTHLLDTTLGSILEMLHPIVNGVAEGKIKGSKGGKKYLEEHGKWLQNHPEGNLYNVVYRPPMHWTACKVAAGQQRIQYGDGLGWKRPKKFFEGLGLWLRDQTGGDFTMTDDLCVARQLDGFNCGIIAINTIANNVFGDPLWTAGTANGLRMKAFCDIVKAAPWMKKSGFNGVPSEFDLTDCAQNILAVGFAINEDLLAVDDVRRPESQAPAPATESTNVEDVDMEAQQPTETKGLKRRAEQPLEELEGRRAKEAKTRSVTIVTPAIFLPLQSRPSPLKPQTKASATKQNKKPTPAVDDPSSGIVGISRAATKARELRANAKNGTFVASDAKTAAFRQKIITKWDPDAEFEEMCKRVLCSMCKQWVAMKEPYNIAHFKTHCGGEMQGCTRVAPVPRKTAKTQTITMDHFFTALPPAKPVNAVKPKASKMVARPCPGLSAAYDEKCGMYLERSGAPGGGARAVSHYAQALFGGKKFENLTYAEKEQVYAARHHDHTWRNDFTSGIMASFAMGTNACLKTVQVDPHSSAPPAPCTSCRLLFTSKSYQAVLVKPLPKKENFKFVPNRNQNAHAGKQFSRYKGLEDLFAEDNEYSNELRYVKHVLNGDFKDDNVFRGIVATKVLAKERQLKGRGMQNFKHSEDLDALGSMIHVISPRSYRELSSHLVLRTDRSIRHKISSAPRFPIGIIHDTYQYASQYCQDYGYPFAAPISLSVDDTKLYAALRPLYNGLLGKWFIVGTTGEAMEVPSAEMVNATLDKIKRTGELAVRLWVLQIPLAGVPPLVIAIKPIGAKVKGAKLSEWHLELMKGLISRGFRITGSGGDGATVERQCQKLTAAASKKVEYIINHPDSKPSSREATLPSPPPPVSVAVWELDGNVWAEFQDAKHGRKTFRSNASSGARGLILGNHVVFFEQIHDLAMQSDSPMYKRDVKENRDKMDDRAAARLFSADTLEQASRDPEKHLGLVVYLFIFGDLIDAYQSRTLSHHERAKIVLRTHLFLQTWKLFLAKAGYSEARHFISKEAFAISEILVNGLLALILIHRDHLGDHPAPLLPWLYASEPNEHCFAAMRDVNPDFTFQEALLLVPKLRARMQKAVRQIPDYGEYQKVASGYCHTYFTSDGVDYTNLNRYPTDVELSEAYKIASEENECLWTLLGIHPSQLQHSPAAVTPPHPDPDPQLHELYLNHSDILDTGSESAPEPSPAAELQHFIDNLQSSMGLNRADDQQLDAYAMAAVALSLDDLKKMRVINYIHIPAKVVAKSVFSENMPDSDPTQYQEIQREIMTALAAQPAAFIAVLQGLADTAAQAEADNRRQTAHTIVDVSASDLSSLVALRRNNQTREAQMGVRTYKPSGTYTNPQTGEIKPLTDRQRLAQAMNGIIKNDQERGTSTGLNRSVRWKTPADPSQPPKTGNAANAAAMAGKRAADAIRRRRTVFKGLKSITTIAEAGVGTGCPLIPGSYGFVVVGSDMVLACVLAMYTRRGGKAAAHSILPSCENIGDVSYLLVQTFESFYRRQFRQTHSKDMHLGIKRFAHLPSASFLTQIPGGSDIKVSAANIEIGQAAYNIFRALHDEREKIVTAVATLNTVRRKRGQTASILDLEDADDSDREEEAGD
ncbi:hypothetical protein GGX14DRAFT_616418, partial [Mycena pura]